MNGSPSYSADRGTMTVVTAADQNYWRCLHQLLRSAERLSLPNRHQFVAYDLGMKPETRNGLERRFPWCTFRHFYFGRYPAHVSGNLRSHAWKPFVVNAEMHRTTGLLLWLDSASLLRQKLDCVATAIRRHGVYTLAGQSAIADHCDPDILNELGLPEEMRPRPERVSGVLGIDCSNRAARNLVTLWRDYHLDPAHVRVATERHKSDQALLSVALFKMEAKGEIALGNEEIDISSRQPVRWLTTRNKIPDWMPLWADLAVRASYGAYKRLDRFYLVWRHRIANLANGLHRAGREHFSILIASPQNKSVVRIKSPLLGYYADPFIYRYRGDLYLLCERFRFLQHRGELCCIPLRHDLRPGRPRSIMTYEHHASFPLVFESQGRTFLLPETSAEGGIHLYESDSFPQTWTRRQTLVPGVDAADSVIFGHEARYFLITSIRLRPGSAARYLAVYSSDNLLTGIWRPHPVNEKKLYADLPFSSGRNAGPVIRYDGELLRPCQRNDHYYGERARWMKIERLTDTEYVETELPESHPLAQFCADRPMHHISFADGFAAWDFRDRTGWSASLSWPDRATAATKLLATEDLAKILSPVTDGLCPDTRVKP